MKSIILIVLLSMFSAEGKYFIKEVSEYGITTYIPSEYKDGLKNKKRAVADEYPDITNDIGKIYFNWVSNLEINKKRKLTSLLSDDNRLGVMNLYFDIKTGKIIYSRLNMSDKLVESFSEEELYGLLEEYMSLRMNPREIKSKSIDGESYFVYTSPFILKPSSRTRNRNK